MTPFQNTWRPLSVGDILDEAIHLYRKNFALFLGIIALVQVPLLLLQLVSSALLVTTFSGSARSLQLSPAMLVAYASNFLALGLGLIGYVVQLSALTIAASERFQQRETNLKQVYTQTLRRTPAIFVSSLILAVVNFGVIVCSTVLCLFPIVVLVPLNTRWMFSYHAILLEKQDAIAAMRRSWHLVGGYFWRALAVGALIIMLYYMLSVGPTYLLIIATLALGATPWLFIATSVIGALVGALMLPIEIAALTVLYYDLRMRKEGLDLQWKAQRLLGSLAVEGAP